MPGRPEIGYAVAMMEIDIFSGQNSNQLPATKSQNGTIITIWFQPEIWRERFKEYNGHQ